MATLIEAQIADWEKRGVIAAETAATLRADIGASARVLSGKDRPRKRFSFFQVVVTFAAVCFCAAILLFISANWDAIPRLVKVGGLFVLIFAGLTGGALMGRRGGPFSLKLEEAGYLLAGASYVGGVALVSQMYHIGGTIGEAMFAFAIGLGIAGALVRSYVLTAGALGAIAWWYLESPDPENLLNLNFVIAAAFCAAGFAFSRAVGLKWIGWLAVAAFLTCLVPFGWEVLFWIGERLEDLWDVYQAIPVPIRAIFWFGVFAAASAVLIAERSAPDSLRAMPFLSKPRIVSSFMVGLLALFALHVLFDKGDALYAAGALGVLFSVMVLFLHGKDHRGVRYASYAVFALEVALIYLSTLSTLLGTSGFFLIMGLFLSALALFIWRFEKRFARKNGEG